MSHVGARRGFSVRRAMVVVLSLALAFSMVGLAPATAQEEMPPGGPDGPFAWLDPDFLVAGYATPSPIEAFGEGTSWTQADTTISIINEETGEEVASAVSSISVAGPEQLTFNLDAQLSNGFYQVIFTTGEEVASAFLDVGDPFAWLDPDFLVAGYATPASIEAFGEGTSWTQADTTISVMNEETGEEVASAVSSISVAGPEQLTFNLDAQLSNGFYQVMFTTGEQVTSAFLHVGDPFAWLDPDFLAEGYATPASISAFGQGTSWQQDVTEVAVLHAETGTAIADAVGAVTVTDTEHLTFALEAQLGAGFYEVMFTTGEQVVSAYLHVGQPAISVWPSQVELPYDPPLPVEVSGQGTSFETQTVVEVLDAGDNPVEGAVANVEVWEQSFLTFDLAAQLDPGEHWVQVTTGDQQMRARLQVLAPSPCSILDEPLAEQTQGLTNVGFETGDLAGWTLGRVTDSVAVTGADTFTSPWEGGHMAVLGTPAASAEEPQEPGRNEICQDFVVTDDTEQFVYNVFTYDYTGFDEFRFHLQVTDPATGEVLAAQEQQAWGSDTDLKTSGWQGVLLDLSGRAGETVRLTISAGGTSDTAFPFWAYVDSSDVRELPVAAGPVADTASSSGSVMVDPSTGQVTVAMPFGDVSDVTVSKDLAHPDGAAITSAVLLYGGTPFAFNPVSEGSTVYSGTIPAAAILDNPGGTVAIEVTYDDGPTQVITVGQITLYDPSGIVTDGESGQPVVGADVILHRVPGWQPDVTDAEGNLVEERDCRTVDTREGADWTGEPDADANLGERMSAASPEISPNVNPFVTNSVGYYGWDVAEGCWYVVVEAEGYETRVSPVVGVPPEVLDLDLALTPLPADTTPPGTTDPGTTDPGTTDPGTTDPGTTDPGTTDPGTTDPGTTDPGTTDPGTTDPGTTDQETTAACPADKVQAAPFTDRSSIPSAHQFSIDCAFGHAIVSGFADNTYRPTWRVRRDQMASFIAQALDAAGVELPAPSTDRFRDVTPGSAHDDNIHRLAAAGIVQGGPGGLDADAYGPARTVRRDQMASFLLRAAEFASEQQLASQTQAFTDVPSTNPHFANVNGAAETGLARGFGDHTFRPGSGVRRDQMGSFVIRLLDRLLDGSSAS